MELLMKEREVREAAVLAPVRFQEQSNILPFGR